MTLRVKTRILVGTADGLHTLGGRAAPQLAGHEIRNLSSDADGWWAIVDRRYLYRRRHGSRWKRAVDLQPIQDGSEREALCLLAHAKEVFVGTSHAGLLRVSGEDVATVPGFENHPERDTWYTPWGGPPETRSMALAGTAALYVNVHVGGVLRSTDDGRHWKQTMDIDADAHQIAVDPSRPRHLYAATARGLGVSRDAGVRWTFETDGLHATYQRAVAVSRDRVLASTSHGPRGRQAALYWRPLKGRRPMVKCERGLPEWFESNINTFALATLDSLAAFGTPEGQVFVSDDQGDSWQLVGDGLPPVHCIRIVRR